MTHTDAGWTLLIVRADRDEPETVLSSNLDTLMAVGRALRASEAHIPSMAIYGAGWAMLASLFCSDEDWTPRGQAQPRRIAA